MTAALQNPEAREEHPILRPRPQAENLNLALTKRHRELPLAKILQLVFIKADLLKACKLCWKLNQIY